MCGVCCTQVQAGLGAAARQGPAAYLDPSTAPLQDIITPLDEVNFWAELAANPGIMASPMQYSVQEVRPITFV